MVAVLKDMIIFFIIVQPRTSMKCIPIKRPVSQKLFVFCIYDGNNRNYAAKTKIN